jgi:hypothetical protein
MGMRLMCGFEPLSPAVFEARNGLFEGSARCDRFLVLEVLSRRDWADDGFVWRMRRRKCQHQAALAPGQVHGQHGGNRC